MAKTQFLDYAGLQELISKIKTANTAIKTYAGTLPEDAEQDNVLDYVLAQVEASEFSGNAADVVIADAGNLITATDVEGALAEIAANVATIAGTGTGSFDKAIKDAIGELKVGETSYSTVKAYVDALNAAVLKLIQGETGSLEDLTTTDKSNLVAAINEINEAIGDVDYSDKADKVASATAGNFAGLDADGNLTDSGKKAADFEVAGAAAAVQGETEETVASVDAKITALVGDDANKSVRTIANEELAAQLIAENADESLNTLKEIADWIQQHPKDASAMNTAITNLQTQVGSEAVTGEGAKDATGLVKDVRDLQAALGDGGSVAEAIQDAIDELDLANTYDEKGAAEAVQGNTEETVASVDAKVVTLEGLVGDGYDVIPIADITKMFTE